MVNQCYLIFKLFIVTVIKAHHVPLVLPLPVVEHLEVGGVVVDVDDVVEVLLSRLLLSIPQIKQIG